MGKLLESQRKKKKEIPVLEPIKVKSKSYLSQYHINPSRPDNSSTSPPKLSAVEEAKHRRLKERAELLSLDQSAITVDSRKTSLQIKNLKSQNLKLVSKLRVDPVEQEKIDNLLKMPNSYQRQLENMKRRHS